MLDVHVCKRLGAFALDVAFQGPERGLTALFGPSGSGKSSVVNALAGLMRPDTGHVRIGDVTFFDSASGLDVAQHRRRVGYVFQDARLFPHLSVRDNLLYGLRRAPRPERRIDFDVVVGMLGIDHLLDRRPKALSGGEKQRVGVGRALLSQPRLLLLDEPLAALDAGRKAEILPYIERLRDEVQIPIVYVSHAIEEVARLADHVVVLDHGRVVADGEVTRIMARLDVFPPESPYEAGAVVPVSVLEHDDQFDLTLLTFNGGTLVVPRLAVADGARLRVRIIASDIMLSRVRPTEISALNVLPAVVIEERDGLGCYADVQIAVGATELVARITRRSAAALDLAPGREVFALIKSVAIDGRPVPPDPD